MPPIDWNKVPGRKPGSGKGELPARMFTRRFVFPPDQTCKEEWLFTLSDGIDGAIIESLEIKAHTTDAGKDRGCLGHPLSIAALVRGLPVASIDVEALAQSGCARSVACGQALARCLLEIRKEFAPQDRQGASSNGSS